MENKTPSICTFNKYPTFAVGKTNYITKKKNLKMETLEITTEKTTENRTILYGEIIKYISTKDFTSKFSVLQTKEDFESLITMVNEEKYLYEVKTTRTEMKHLLKTQSQEDDFMPSHFNNYKLIGEGKRIPSYFGEKINRAIVYATRPIAKMTFTSPVNLDNGYENCRLADEVVSIMELFDTTQNGTYYICWEIVNLGIFEQIGVYCYENDKVLSDYDGVFDMPKQARQLLEENGFDCSYLD